MVHSAGGDLHPISQTSHQIRVCVCGQPVRPNIGGVRAGRTGADAQSSVMEAIDGALKSRSEVPQMLAGLYTSVLTREEYEAGSARIADLEAKVEALVQQLTTVPAFRARAGSQTQRKGKQVTPAKIMLPSRGVNLEWVGDLEILEVNDPPKALPGARVQRMWSPDDRLVIQDAKDTDLVCFYASVAAVRHRKTLMIYVVFRETIDALFAGQKNPVKYPRWVPFPGRKLLCEGASSHRVTH